MDRLAAGEPITRTRTHTDTIELQRYTHASALAAVRQERAPGPWVGATRTRTDRRAATAQSRGKCCPLCPPPHLRLTSARRPAICEIAGLCAAEVELLTSEGINGFNSGSTIPWSPSGPLGKPKSGGDAPRRDGTEPNRLRKRAGPRRGHACHADRDCDRLRQRHSRRRCERACERRPRGDRRCLGADRSADGRRDGRYLKQGPPSWHRRAPRRPPLW